jgi:hypothetical protein
MEKSRARERTEKSKDRARIEQSKARARIEQRMEGKKKYEGRTPFFIDLSFVDKYHGKDKKGGLDPSTSTCLSLFIFVWM